ncbi:hypothetical protein Lade_2028 [Legionella adelaidensis]|uniref:DUF4286 domain-containing protein n=1 Tax=Legionella adelaidensis TaxID=45056 RepID=A0A0W0R158_9GAMM|nr:DUF4286 family protein [Legionella adelaidensis]KTC64734.1 hypothetical protein Lade_2028 [Legionella adelaidensis]
MIIYEVKLNIDVDIYSNFNVWLRAHVIEMLQFRGFHQATILEEEDKTTTHKRLTIQYQVASRDDLQHYFTEFSQSMREKGRKLFKDKFSATRRIYNVQEVIPK